MGVGMRTELKPPNKCTLELSVPLVPRMLLVLCALCAQACEDGKIIRSTVADPNPSASASPTPTKGNSDDKASKGGTFVPSVLPGDEKQDPSPVSSPSARSVSAPANDGLPATANNEPQVAGSETLRRNDEAIKSGNLNAGAQELRAACEEGSVWACLRVARHALDKGAPADAVSYYLKSCTKTDTRQKDASCKATESYQGDAYGCFRAALVQKQENRAAEARSTMKCACVKGYTKACPTTVRAL